MAFNIVCVCVCLSTLASYGVSSILGSDHFITIDLTSGLHMTTLLQRSRDMYACYFYKQARIFIASFKRKNKNKIREKKYQF